MFKVRLFLGGSWTFTHRGVWQLVAFIEMRKVNSLHYQQDLSLIEFPQCNFARYE